MVSQEVGEAGRVGGTGLASEREAGALGQRAAPAAGTWAGRSEGPAAQGRWGPSLFFNNVKANVFLPLLS